MPATIVKYTDYRRPINRYPIRIVSPTRSGMCCVTQMQAVGELRREGDFAFQYRRCAVCGFTVRGFLRATPTADPEACEILRRKLEAAFTRNDVPE